MLDARANVKTQSLLWRRNPKESRWSVTLLAMRHVGSPGMVLNEQGPGRHSRDAPCHDLDTVSSEQGSGRRILSGAPHRRPGVVQNEQHYEVIQDLSTE